MSYTIAGSGVRAKQGEIKMLPNFFRGDKGYTLIEMIATIIVISSLASIAIPKFIDLTDEAQKAKCQAFQGAISSAAAMNYALAVLNDPSQADWLENLKIEDVEADWFATGVVPVCPSEGVYTLVNGNVVCSIEDHNWNP